MFLLDQKAKRYGKRPAELLLIDPEDEPLLANSIDNAAYLWGSWVEGMLGERDDKGNPKHTLHDLLGPEREVRRGRYASPGRKRDW
jgi:hypothetical protein